MRFCLTRESYTRGSACLCAYVCAWVCVLLAAGVVWCPGRNRVKTTQNKKIAKKYKNIWKLTFFAISLQQQTKKVMQKVFIFSAITGEDITPFVRLAVGAGGDIRVFNSLNIDITENIIFGLE